ncbi:H-type lectin domain-containing protein [Sagittula sp. SSi028]|uniref:H-type lectin domain-containing protein n=1 Tax=Sagittula sp. SSi028 TaxID=3400636 RepID=UPI003AF9E46A
MRKFSGATLGVDQGNAEVFTDFKDGGPMWTGEGARERRRAVIFSDPFAEVPVVHVGLSLWDMDQGANVRADISAENVTTTGFELVFRTWSDTKVARVRMNWLAMGALKNEDDWDLY